MVLSSFSFVFYISDKWVVSVSSSSSFLNFPLSVFLKNNKNGGGTNNNKNHEEEKEQATTTVLKIATHKDRSVQKILKAVCVEDGVDSVKVDKEMSLITVDGYRVDPIRLVIILRKKFCFAELISHGRRNTEDAEEAKNGSSGGGGGDDNGNGGGGGDNKKKDRGGYGDGDGNDEDKGEEGGGGGDSKGSKMDFMGEAGFDYKYGYHSGSENGCPTGQLQCPGIFITTQILVN